MKTAWLVFIVCLIPGLARAGARTDADEALVTSVCQSTAPVLVIDNFAGNPSNEMDIDLDGNGTYDDYHGDFVAKLIEVQGHSTIRALIGTPVYPSDILSTLQTYIARIKSGNLRISRINFSQGFPIDFDSLNQLIGAQDVINGQNVYLYGDRILKALWTLRPDLKLQELYGAFQELGQLGIPVYIAAGNSGFNEVNLYSLFPDVHSVGALDLKGEKADYSADNSTVTIWRRGSIPTYAVSGGIAIGNDRKADFALATPPVPQDVLSQLNGKNPNRVASQIPQQIENANNDDTATFSELAAKLPKGLYSTNDVLQRALGTLFQQAGYIQTLGDYFYMDGVHPNPLFFVHVDPFSDDIVTKQGVESPDGREFRNVIYGTSFASPSICDGERTPEADSL